MNAGINKGKEIADLEIRPNFIPSDKKKKMACEETDWNKEKISIEWKGMHIQWLCCSLDSSLGKKKKVGILVLHLPSIPSVRFSVESARMPEADSSSSSGSSNTTSSPVPAGHEQSTDVFPSHSRRLPPYRLHPKAEDIRREQIRKSHSFKIEEPLVVVPSNHENIAFESKQEREYVSTMPASVG